MFILMDSTLALKFKNGIKFHLDKSIFIFAFIGP